MALRIPLGVSEFREIRERKLTYVDKTALIGELIRDTAKAILLPRPRRFGKTLNLSMLRTFLEKSGEALWPLFEGLSIADDAESRAHFQRYPTIAMTFKDVKAGDWPSCREAMARVIAQACNEHRYLLEEGALRADEAGIFNALLFRRATEDQLQGALQDLSAWLHRYHGESVLVLIDEYDTPIHGGFTAGYYDEAVLFFRNFLSGGLKDNRHLWKGVLTGVLRIAKDSVLTGLNNLEVMTLLDPRCASAFGFTEAEVEGLLTAAGKAALLPEVQRWYNGYVFGGQVVYNPWSVLSFLKRGDDVLQPYWVETRSNDLIRELLVTYGQGFTAEMGRLVRGEAIEQMVVEHVALRDAREQRELLFSVLLFTGYLKSVAQRREARTLWCTLAIPNQEVLSIYETLFLSWAREGLGGDAGRQELLRALLRGDAETAEQLIERWLQANASFIDTARHDPPERFYHGFVLGLLVSLGARYEVLSNPESGYGRCDLMLVPRAAGEPGLVMELKVRDARRGETVEQALERAFAQIEERDYRAKLLARGAAPIHEMAAIFDGKQVTARTRPAR